MRILTCLLTISAAIGLSACTQFPELEGSISASARQAPYPTLLPDALLGTVQPVEDAPDIATSLTGRAANLRARGDILRGAPIVDPQDRAAMIAALERLGG
ncbi:hypothetical protein [Candidatus Halocynthiibacter alkanivorans]|uniref:hypothetical protein n=1 Tax=Candidatus Halocynthiibacter alkanivorans TaxID=2267619 RepID=UPI000DF2E44C|nr:hypothetical protein [Candidatus Halocynthiibacter alkanivorans]